MAPYVVTAICLMTCFGIACARPMAATPAPKNMPVPCYLKIYDGFCFTSSDQNSCTFYANPSYATFKECSEDRNMGKISKCADVSAELKKDYEFSYKTCVDKEVLRGGTNSGNMRWTEMPNMDVSGKDIPAGGKPFTEVCGGLEQVMQQCAKTSACAGFTWNGNCGYLKTTTAERTGRGGWKVFAVKK